MKSCAKCKELKPRVEFGKDSKRKDKLNPYCLICKRANSAKYYQANKVEISKKNAERYAANADSYRAKEVEKYAANRDKELARCAAKYQRRKEKVLAQQKEYYAYNKEKHFALIRNRRARVKKSEGRHTASDVSRIFESQRGLCANCEIRLLKSGANKFHVDHIVPISKGGSNWPDNLQCLCPTCNRRKSAKLPDEWAAQNGRLL